MATSAQPPPPHSKEELVRLVKAGKQAWSEWKSTGQPLDLRGADLASADLTGIDLSEANLRDANLRNAKMAGANLSKADLRGADLSYTDLTKAKLQQTNMRGASLLHASLAEVNLYQADLARATLQSANLKGVHLIRTDLRDANLRDTDLRDIRGPLLPSQLAGADLTAAALPEPLEKFYEKLGSVSDISDSAKKLFLALLAACVYSWLTIGTTKDVDLITNRASSPLPIIQTAIPIVGFYVVAPIILLCIYFYFHFYLQKLWEELAQFPAIFPDGRPLYARADPWLFNDLVRAHFPKLKMERPFLSYFQQFISILLAWWLVPITLLLFWGRYLPRHDLTWTMVLALMLGLSIVSAWRLYRLAKGTLRDEKRLSLKKTLRTRNPYIILLVTIALVKGLIVISEGAIHGQPYGVAEGQPDWVPWETMFWVYSPFANLADVDISIKPAGWTGKKLEELDQVKGANLNSQDLRYAQAERAFLAKARLAEAILLGADMTDANLQQAYLPNASLLHATLTSANLNGADLEGAFLINARLDEADLTYARVTGASFDNANLRFVDFRHAEGLVAESLKKGTGWETAFYDPAVLHQLGLPADHNEALADYRKSGSREPFDDAWMQKWRENKAKTPKTKPK